MMPTPAPGAAPDQSIALVAALVFTAALAAALALVAGGLVRRLVSHLEGPAGHAPTFGTTPIRLVRAITFVVAMTALVFPALALAGISLPVALDGRALGQWVAQTALRVGIILLVALTASRLVSALIGRAVAEMSQGVAASPAALERHKRADTIGRTLTRFLSAIVWSAALLMMLRAIDVDITPILTGAGILGLAVGFGAQTLVKDIISGFFVILEDQVRVGDVAVVNGTSGTVEQINLRTLVLRDIEGTVHVFPNGSITTLANRSKDFAFAVIDIGIDYDDDIDAAIASVQTTAAAMRSEPAFSPHMLEPLEVMGVDSLGASSVGLRFRVKTAPLSQWVVARELRRRIKKAFDADGIRIPVQQVAVTLRNPAALPLVGPRDTPGPSASH
jgi:small-conductance mechanosensitive channel